MLLCNKGPFHFPLLFNCKENLISLLLNILCIAAVA